MPFISFGPHLFQWHSFVLGVALVYRGGNPWKLCTFYFSVISASWMESRFSLAGGVNQPPGQSQSTASLNVDPIQARGDLLAKAILQVDGTNKNKSRMKEWRKRWASQNPMNYFRGAIFPNIHSLLQQLLQAHPLVVATSSSPTSSFEYPMGLWEWEMEERKARTQARGDLLLTRRHPDGWSLDWGSLAFKAGMLFRVLCLRPPCHVLRHRACFVAHIATRVIRSSFKP